MHAQCIIQDLLDTKCSKIHAKRRCCIAKVAEAAGIGGLGVVRMGAMARLEDEHPIPD